MLRQLAIHNIVLVERLELEFEPGLGVLTGETGAGKSILLDALGLALGARADAGLVRAGAESASVSAELELPPDHAAHGLLGDQGVAIEPGEPLIVRRTLKSDGGSRAFLGSASVPAGLLREVGALAVEIHGQHDDRGLLNPKGHRALLDAFGGLDSSDVEAGWSEVVQIEAELGIARAELAAAERDREWLAHASGEIEALAPEQGEETLLADERSAMQAGLKAGESLSGLDELLGGSEGALSLLRQAARRIERGAADHPLLAEALAALDRAVIEASEAEDRIARAADALAFDPARLDQVEARLFDIRGLARKHRVEPDSLAALGEQMRAQLAAIDAGGERIEGLDRQLIGARERYAEAAAKLSHARREAAAKLDSAVAGELAPLKLELGAIPHRIRRDRARPLRRRPRGVRSLHQSWSAVRAADPDRVGRRAVALHPRAQGCPRGSRHGGDDDLRRGRPWGRRRGRERDRRAPGPTGAALAGAGRHPLAAGGGARLAPLSDREKPRLRRHSDDGPQALGRGAARRDRADAFGSLDHRGGARAGLAFAGRGMTSYVALLRAVNVGGRAPKMDDLKRIAADIGLESPRTFIASGNLLFASDKSEAAVKRELEAALADHMGKPVEAMVRTAREIAHAVEANPFAREADNRVAAIFFDEAPAEAAIAGARNVVNERLALGRREIYVHYPDGQGRSKLKLGAKALGTARNMNTVAKLAELAREMS